MMEEFVKRLVYILGLAGVFFCGDLAWAINVQNADYYQAGSNVWYCASTTTTPGTSVAGLTASPVNTLILQNPAGSKNKLVIKDIGVDYFASPAAAAGLFLAYTVAPSTGAASTTAGTVTSAFIGTSTGTFSSSSANCYVSATLPKTPTFYRALGGTTGAAAIGGVQLLDKTDTQNVIPPGGIMTLGTTSASQIFGHISWVEVPQ